MENPYNRAPLQVTLYDVSAGAPVRSYMFLGDVPRNVIDAARRGTPSGRHPGRLPQLDGGKLQSSAWPEATWGKSDSATLQRYYGTRWRWLLTPRVGAVLGPPCDATPDTAAGGAVVTGGDVDFGNLDDFDDIDIVIEEGELDDSPEALTELPSPDPASRPKPSAPGDSAYRGFEAEPDWDPRTVYADVAAYPEDTFSDLKSKIYAATGIPPYRQHLFYPVGGDEGDEDAAGLIDQRPTRTTYRVTVEGALVLTDVRRFSQDLCAARRGGSASGDTVSGVPVDRRLEERKEDVRVDALDTFRTLEESPGVYIRRVFVADLATLLRTRGAGLQRAISDRYQFDLLYYGLALKFWPSLSPEAFRLALTDPGAIPGTFPLLDPPIEKVEARLQAEQAVIDGIYSQTKAQQTRREREEKKGGLAVTEASVNVEPRAAKTPVNIRNIFDWVPATRHVPAFVARIHPDSMEGGSAARGRRDYILEKTHVAAAAPRVAGTLERFLAHPPRRPGVSYAIVRDHAGPGAQRRGRSRVQSTQPQFVFFTVYDDGRYTIESSWREDDRVGFDEVIRQLSSAARPIIELINAMGAAALPLGGTLETPSEASKGISSRATIGSLTVSTFWPHALTTEGFRDMKTRWREYEKAGIVGIRGLQQAGAYTFYFRKGITNYDPRAMERVVARGAGAPPGGRQVVTNHYTYLTDPATAQRWQYVYAGRLVRVYHRTTDLRIEIIGVDMEEFRRIQLYVYVFLDGLVYGPDRLKRGIVKPGQARPTEGRLRGLQERDPDLYDLKKFDEGATVYSVLCQGDRQPEMVTEEEARGLSAKKRAELVKYWNFTEGRPTYYQCPSKRFPHLSFRAGEHPLGYCLPCCKKTRALAGSKAQAINRHCLQKHQLTEDDEVGIAGEDPLAVSRHVLSYGKAIPVGRISHIPRLLSDGLFYDSIPSPFVYRLIGVVQQTPSLPDAGFFYSLAASLSLEPNELVRELADTALALSDTYQSLAGGGATVFVSAEDLADAIVGTFLLGDEAARFSPFGPGGMAANSWRQLISDLVHIRYDVDVVVFVDESGEGSVTFEASASSAARIRACGVSQTRGSKRAAECGIAADVAILVALPSGTYPLVAMDQREFLRHAYGRGPARRFFSSEYGEEEVTDRVVDILRDMVVAETSALASESGARGVFDLEFVSRLSEAEGYRVLYRLINLRDQCYGVVLAPRPESKDLVYFPVPYAPHFLAPPAESGPAPTALYGPRPDGSYPAQALAKVLAAANKLAAVGTKASSRVTLRPTARLVVDGGGSLVGFIAEAAVGTATDVGAGGVGVYFHHDPLPAAQSKGLPWGTSAREVANAAIPYDMRDIDRAIYEAGGIPARPSLPAEKMELAREGLYRHRLYRLFLAEFAALLQGERNAKIRRSLKALFKKTRFSSPSSLSDFRRELAHILADFPDDADSIRSLVATLYSRVGPSALRKALDEAFDATVFDFDRTTLTRLRALGAKSGPAKVEDELARLMRGQVELAPGRGDAKGADSKDDDGGMASLQNMYVACSLPSDVGRPQCIRQRLKMPADRYQAYVSILTADILNPMKATTLGTMTAGVVDGSRFVTRPGERIHIR